MQPPAKAERNLDRREPQIALGLVPGPVDDPIRWIHPNTLHPNVSDPRSDHELEPPQLTPLCQRRRRHPRALLTNARSNGSNREGPGACDYLGGPGEATALATVSRVMPSCLPIARIDIPTPRRRRISAQSSTVITHPIVVGWPTFRTALLA